MKFLLLAGMLVISACQTPSPPPQDLARANAMSMCHNMHPPEGFTDMGAPIHTEEFHECFNHNFGSLLSSYTQQSIAEQQLRQQQAAAFMQQQQAYNAQQQLQRQQAHQTYMDNLRANRPITTNCNNTGFGNVQCTSF